MYGFEKLFENLVPSNKIPLKQTYTCQWETCAWFCLAMGAGSNSVVERPVMVQWVFGSIPHGGPTELFLDPVSDPRLVLQMLSFAAVYSLTIWMVS